MICSDLPFFPPANTRMHEVCGPGAYAFAVGLAARLGGPFMWIREAWDSRQIYPTGLAQFVNPADLTVCNTQDQTETLAASEEALRSGAVSLVVFLLSKPSGLTEGRRLQLAARAGKATGLAIIPEGMGSNAAETRWHCTPVFDPVDSTLQKWELIKNKSGTLGIWHVRWNAASHRFTVVPPAGK
jgi:protein ImuA